MHPLQMTADELAVRRLALAGYLIREKSLFYVANDDFDRGLELARIGDSYGPQDDYWFLISYDWPHSVDEVFCPECRQAEVAFGDVCPSCSVQITGETRGEMASDAARGK